MMLCNSESLGFWALSTARNSKCQKTQRFGNNVFPSSGVGREKQTLLCSLKGTNFNHWRSNFRKLCFPLFRIPHDAQSVVQKPIDSQCRKSTCQVKMSHASPIKSASRNWDSDGTDKPATETRELLHVMGTLQILYAMHIYSWYHHAMVTFKH